VRSDLVAPIFKWLRWKRITTPLVPVTANSCAWPRYSADGHYVSDITARSSAIIGD